MYSVEDLLISHGYKLPKAGPASSSSATSVAAAAVAPAAAPAAAPYDKRYGDCHRDAADTRPARGSLNGHEAERGGACVYGGGVRPAPLKGYPADSEGQRRKEAFGIGYLGDAAGPLGDSLATDSGFYDAPSLTYSEQLLSHDERDVSYWRRRGQDFSVLLDYADGRELRASAGSWRPQALIAAEEHRERQHQLWEDLSWLRDPDCGPGQLRVTGERKCQSLGTEEWKPAVGLGRQLSDGEGERWAQDQYRLRAAEGAALPRTKGKSQSLPRVLSPDGTEHTDVVPSRPGQLDRQRVNSTVFSGPYSRYYYSAGVGRDRWGRGWPSGHVALLPKPRFSRPVKPPSYEIHQQTRGSSEMIATDQGSKQKDRPIYYYPRGGELQRQDYFAQHSTIFGMEPPGYIPPPSYKRAPFPRGGPINRNELTNYQYKWRGEVMQVPVSAEAARWFSRQTGGSWLEHYGDRGVAYRKQVHPGYMEEHPGHVRYLPFEDPRVRQISGGPGGNSLTDSDKIRNINKEIPCAKVLGQSSHDSAFPPPQGLSLNSEGRKTSLNDNDSSNRWCNRGINKGSDAVASEQSCANYPAAFQVRQPPPPPPPQSKPVDQGVVETVTQVKKNDPEPEKEKPKSIKKKLNETIFCLVSVPTPLASSGTSRDQNNNDEKPPDLVESPSENKTGHLTNQSLQSTSSAEAELQALTGSMASSITSSRSSSKVVKRIPCRPPKINHYKELKLSGTWPSNQYRDQETQTSPEARKPAPPGPENKEAQEPVPSGSDSAPDSGAAFSCPIMGVKSLKPSSNSAFSRTSTFSSQLNKSAAQTSAPPSGNVEEAKPAAATGGGGGSQVVFGQFLLKPVSRRPWDAIEELETINKELQNHQQQQQQSSKGSSVDQCIEDLNEAYKDILELGTASNKVPNDSVQIPERIKIRLSGEPLNKPSSLRRSMESWSGSVDPEYREVKSAFSRPAAKSVTFSKQLREELPVPPRETGFREYRVIPNLSHRRNSDGRTVKLDLPDEPIEMPLCDFSPTMHTAAAEVPWADRQPMQDASTLTSPPDYEDICQTLRQSRDSAEAKTGKSKPGTGDAQPLQGSRVDSEEECPICRRESENQMRQIPMPPLHEEDCSELTNQNGATDDNSAAQCAASENMAEGKDTRGPADPGSNQSEPDLGPDRGEQPPLVDEDAGGTVKTDSAPSEIPDSSNEAKSAEGIPESESIEERAARILGIDVPVAALVTAEQGVSKPATEEIESTESEPATEDVPESRTDKPTSCAKAREDPDSRSTKSADRQDVEKKQQAILEPRIVLRTHLGRDHPGLPEFPPDRLPLSVPPNPDRRLSLSMEGERRSRGPSQRIEALQDKLVASPSRVAVERLAVERLARMKEVDSVSRIRRLSIRSTDSGEGDGEGVGGAKGGPGDEAPPPPQSDTVDDPEVTQTPPVSIETVLQDEDEAPTLSEAHDQSKVERE